MQAVKPTTCCKCGALKRETNHWWVLVTNGAGGYWQRFDDFECAQDSETVSIVCGAACFLRVTSEWLGEARDGA